MKLAKEDLDEMSRENLIRFARWLKVIPTFLGSMMRIEDCSDEKLREEIDEKMNPNGSEAVY